MHKFTLLYVEDDVELREQFVRILQPKFKYIYEASDGIQALELYKKHHPDMMIIDINLPKINGLEVIENIRKTNMQLPIVVLSAYSDQEKLLKAVKLGLTDYLVKPVPYKTLLGVLEEMCQKCTSKSDSNISTLINGYTWEKEEKRLYLKNVNIVLTKREAIFLEVLISNANKVVVSQNIESHIWKNDYMVDHSTSLGHLIKRLRKKLPEALFENIYGEGYRILKD